MDKTEPASEAERIRREAILLYADNGPLVVGYISGATAERSRAQEEITRLKAELESERELRKDAWNGAINGMKSYAAQQNSEYKEYFELAEKAKQVLRDKGYGWTGLDILETCKLVPKADNES